VTFADEVRSIGGVSDLRFAVAYTLSDRVLVGVGVHALAGSTRLGVQRQFLDSAGAALASFSTYSDLAVTDFTATSLSAGVQVRLNTRAAFSAMARVNSRMTARATTGATARVGMPVELGFGAQLLPLRSLNVAASVGYATWSRAGDALAAAGQERPRDVWNVAVGAEYESLRLLGRTVPVRVGYHWRQLPFSVDGALLSDHAVAGGLGLDFAGGRATLDFGVEVGTRAAGAARERYTAGFVGVLVRP
jgi:long-subunit fatty acid transport protein